jgi:hypothetical protein
MVPRTLNSMNTQQLIERLAWLIEADGAGAHNVELSEVAELAKQRGVRSSVVELLADSAAPQAVRERAFGYVAVRMASTATELAHAA